MGPCISAEARQSSPPACAPPLVTAHGCHAAHNAEHGSSVPTISAVLEQGDRDEISIHDGGSFPVFVMIVEASSARTGKTGRAGKVRSAN